MAGGTGEERCRRYDRGMTLHDSGLGRGHKRGYERREGWFRRKLWLASGVAASAAAVCGCANEGGGEGLNAADRSVRNARAEMQPRGTATGAATPSDRPAAMMGNETVSWGELTRPLAEAAGAAVLEEVCLDRLIAREMQLRGVTLEPGAVEREAQLMEETMALASGVASSQAGELVLELRRTRGLGDARWGAMLQRNAMLRRMVRDEVAVSPQDVEQAHEIRYGQRFQTRLIVTRTEQDAAAALGRLRGGQAFADVATSLSVDTSRLRGGAIGAISPADPSFPLSLRKAVTETPVGVPSGVIATESTYAIVLVEQVVPPTGVDLSSVSAALEREVRVIRERQAMDRLAAQLLRATKITVLDPSLDWSWRQRE
jgi:hypothetical protein